MLSTVHSLNEPASKTRRDLMPVSRPSAFAPISSSMRVPEAGLVIDMSSRRVSASLTGRFRSSVAATASGSTTRILEPNAPPSGVPMERTFVTGRPKILAIWERV